MQRVRIGGVDVQMSRIGLGGHEFLDDGRVRGMAEDFYRAVMPGTIWDGFGGDTRRRVLEAAYECGINVFDVTMDSEKEGLGRNLKELPPPYAILVQTRPEGMVYGNDPSDKHKTRLLDYDFLRWEAERAAGLLGRDKVEFYNVGLYPPAVRRHRGYVEKVARNMERLKGAGLIRFACVDTLSKEEVSLRMIETGAFDAVFTNVSIVCDGALQRVIPAARERGMAIIAREAFAKGALFSMGEAAGIVDRAKVAGASIRWILSQGVVTTLVVGAAEPEHLRQNAAAAESPVLTDEDEAVIEAIRRTAAFSEARAVQDAVFADGLAPRPLMKRAVRGVQRRMRRLVQIACGRSE